MQYLEPDSDACPSRTPRAACRSRRPAEQDAMRVAGRLAADVLDMIGPHVVPGVTTDELDRICHDYIVDVQQAIPAPLDYRGFPKSICTSVNHVVCHGIPGDKRLKQGDIVNIDVTVIKDGFHGDTSRMFFVGKPLPHAQRLCDLTYRGHVARHPRGAARARASATSARRSSSFVEANHCSVVREYCGHGIGRVFHEDPQVLHYGTAGTGARARGRHDLHDRADGQRRQARRAPAARRLDGDHARPLAVGAVGAHGPRHRRPATKC